MMAYRGTKTISGCSWWFWKNLAGLLSQMVPWLAWSWMMTKQSIVQRNVDPVLVTQKRLPQALLNNSKKTGGQSGLVWFSYENIIVAVKGCFVLDFKKYSPSGWTLDSDNVGWAWKNGEKKAIFLLNMWKLLGMFIGVKFQRCTRKRLYLCEDVGSEHNIADFPKSAFNTTDFEVHRILRLPGGFIPLFICPGLQ